MKYDLRKVIITTIFLTVAIVLDVLTSSIPGLNLSMPFGGKFFGISMIPLIIIGLLFGLKYGLAAGFVYALYNFSFDYLIYLSTLKEVLESWTGTKWTAWHIISLILFDYIIPFTAFGLSGLFKLKSETNYISIVKSVVLVSVTRLISATISGVLLWGSSIKYAASTNDTNFAVSIFKFVGNNLVLYSFVYNLIYILTTGIVVLVIFYIIKDSLKAILSKVNY